MTVNIQKWLSTSTLKKLLIDPKTNKHQLVNIARLCAAYYLDFELFIPTDDQITLPSLYIWEGLGDQNLPTNCTKLDRFEVQRILPPEYTPSLPALILIHCDCLIESIAYVDQFDDKRSSIIIRLLADSQQSTDLCGEFCKSMLIEGVLQEITLTLNNNNNNYSSFYKFSERFAQSIVELETFLQHGILDAFIDRMLEAMEEWFIQLPIDYAAISSCPIYTFPKGSKEEADWKEFAQIHLTARVLLEVLRAANRITSYLNATLLILSNGSSGSNPIERILVLTLRLIMRQKFSDSLSSNDDFEIKRYGKFYKELLEEPTVVKSFADEFKDAGEIERFFNFVQENYPQKSSLPSLTPSSREYWLRRYVLNNKNDFRDSRDDEKIDWFRYIYTPTHKVPDMTLSQMLLIDAQWTTPGFSFISGHAIRLSIRPDDICQTRSFISNSASARDILYQPSKIEHKLFTPRDSFEPRIDRLFQKKQVELCELVENEKAFLDQISQTRSYSPPKVEEKTEMPSMHRKIDEMINKIDNVLSTLAQPKSMYIKDDEDAESIANDLPYNYDDAPIATLPSRIEKINMGSLTSVAEASQLSTAREPWMNLIPTIDTQTTNLLLYDPEEKDEVTEKAIRSFVTNRDPRTIAYSKRILDITSLNRDEIDRAVSR